ncbi:MAG: phosphoribosylglycinamide formyltransferase [Flavobacteriaceae bacterium]|nr:phosphoribosylglycinamide formyltransferase [Flavobacteriaceae bacterium]MCY4254375.1 phosphoribosylglycinamide formyltransferase [Flavobacteriaceae bacterium]
MNQASKIVLFASGSGSNALRLCQYFENNSKVQITSLFCNNANAGVIEKVKPFGIKTVIFSKVQLESGEVLEKLKNISPEMIVLAGFLLKLPGEIVSHFSRKIVNIHPSLLPKYGGKGMYGHHVHQAVKNSGDNKTGLTIHYVDQHYDSGAIIFQKSVDISPNDTPQDIAQKVLKLEHYYYASVIHALMEDLPYDW